MTFQSIRDAHDHPSPGPSHLLYFNSGFGSDATAAAAVVVVLGKSFAFASSYLQMPPVLSASGASPIFGPNSSRIGHVSTREKYLRSQVRSSAFSCARSSRCETSILVFSAAV